MGNLMLWYTIHGEPKHRTLDHGVTSALIGVSVGEKAFQEDQKIG